MKNLKFISLLALLVACGNKEENPTRAKLKEEVLAAETAFMLMAQVNGVAAAFYEFADSTAVIKRMEDSLVIGRENIKLFYSDPKYIGAKVQWTPDLVDVSASGDMAYCYGKYKWEMKDSAGTMHVYDGVYQTVWKKQKDGGWKYVWD